MSEITAALRDHMLHATGRTSHPYRNFYWTDPDSDDARDWAPAVDAGLAWRSKPQAGFGGMVMFAVTDAGFEALGITDLSGLEPRERFGRTNPHPLRDDFRGEEM